MPAFKRKIFYLSGFDPRGARFYQQLYTEQAAIFGATTGRTIEVGDRRREPPRSAAWTVRDREADAETDYVFLNWDDVVRAHWVKNPVGLLGHSLRAYGNFTRRVDWSIVHKFPWGVKIAFYYPGISTILLPILFGLLLAIPLIALLGWGWGLLASAMAGIGIAMGVVKKIQGFWLLRFIIFNDKLARGMPADVDARMAEFAEAIRASFAEDRDEILFVTHSNGSILAMPVMARLLEACGGTLPDRFSLVTLGSSIPLIGARRDSRYFRALLDKVGAGDFRWLDVNSITDGACIAGIDPCIGGAPRSARLFQTSPRWFRYCDPASYQARRRNKYETHFDYLKTFDRISPLDYVAISSGARPLAKSIEAFKAENNV
ncbi:hypothetical protein [Rhizorhabdus dicambivorans]|uniref:DUF829 domain-containing protein n=1 Tax=Rhizorhabdus dicambivorans TaxID=1850238 RepID=A0A2A4FZ45_9SPHN|nr:hypothetical protein [Rhizorhabdus dicambivorans]ATE64800.1 hypothetical protein CMV14_10650 [Rhizorhabdus dicambivorans]PCE44077.1 hypothetical protein COO09_00035 [Rhizorhabdus dicambivorans]